MHRGGEVHCPAGLAAVASLAAVVPGDVRQGLHGRPESGPIKGGEKQDETEKERKNKLARAADKSWSYPRGINGERERLTSLGGNEYW
jgi:hypothetical protein